MRGRVFDIQRFSVHDGPGIRTTVFLKGCPLKCLWCGNPESIPYHPSLSFLPERCIGCGDCLAECPEHALSLSPRDRVKLDRALCTECGKCSQRCDAKALEIVGRDMSVGEVMDAVLRDRNYFDSSGGGVTLSGGDPLFQPDFSVALCRQAKSAGLHCTLETSGHSRWEVLKRLHPYVDLWLYDYKETDSARHARFTGVPNSLILANLRKLDQLRAKVLLRCPMIPQHNARREHLDGIVSLARSLSSIRGVELLPYYDLWRAKLNRFGLKSSLPESVKPPDHHTVKAWSDYLRQRNVRVIG